MKTSVINRGMGMLFLSGAAAIYFFGKCPNKMGNFLIYTLVALAISFLLPKSAEKTVFEIWGKTFSINFVGSVALFFVLIFADPVKYFEKDSCTLKRTITVFVQGKNGRQDKILQGHGTVLMTKGSSSSIPKSIDENGEVQFADLILGDKLRFTIKDEHSYLLVHPDSVYTVEDNGIIDLPVYPGGVGRISGIVFFKQGPLRGVYVKIDELSTLTDSTGSFHIDIPDSLQKLKYEVWFMKKGFLSVKEPALPQSGQQMEVTMEQ